MIILKTNIFGVMNFGESRRAKCSDDFTLSERRVLGAYYPLAYFFYHTTRIRGKQKRKGVGIQAKIKQMIINITAYNLC